MVKTVYIYLSLGYGRRSWDERLLNPSLEITLFTKADITSSLSLFNTGNRVSRIAVGSEVITEWYRGE